MGRAFGALMRLLLGRPFGQLLEGDEAAYAVEGAGFTEDDEAFEQRWAGGLAGEDGAEQHEVFFHGPLFGFAEGFEG